MMHNAHRRRIKTEEKAKVIAAAWRAELIQFLAALATYSAIGRYEQQDDLHQDHMKSRMNSSLSSNHPGAKQLTRQGILLIQFCPPNTSHVFCLLFCLYSVMPIPHKCVQEIFIIFYMSHITAQMLSNVDSSFAYLYQAKTDVMIVSIKNRKTRTLQYFYFTAKLRSVKRFSTPFYLVKPLPGPIGHYRNGQKVFNEILLIDYAAQSASRRLFGSVIFFITLFFIILFFIILFFIKLFFIRHFFIMYFLYK